MSSSKNSWCNSVHPVDVFIFKFLDQDKCHDLVFSPKTGSERLLLMVHLILKLLSIPIWLDHVIVDLGFHNQVLRPVVSCRLFRL